MSPNAPGSPRTQYPIGNARHRPMLPRTLPRSESKWRGVTRTDHPSFGAPAIFWAA